MSETDWVNTNKNRLFPFDVVGAVMLGAYELPRALLADAGFALGIRAEMDAAAIVWLYSVTRALGAWTLTFRCRSSEDVVGTHQFVITIPAGTAEGTTIFVEATPVPTGAVDAEYGTAYIVVGDLSVANAATPIGTYTQITPEDSLIFPSLVQTLHQHYVRRLHLANDPQVTFLPCGDPDQTFTVDVQCPPAVVMARDLLGALKFEFGCNAKVGLSLEDSRLIIGSGIGIGTGIPCVEVSRDPGGSLPAAPLCSETVRMINGVSPNERGEFTFSAGSGMEVVVNGATIEVRPDPQAFCTDLWESSE